MRNASHRLRRDRGDCARDAERDRAEHRASDESHAGAGHRERASRERGDADVQRDVPYNTTKRSNGSVVFAGALSDWSYASPAGQRIVTNGTTVCVYEPTANQLYMQRPDESQYAALALVTQSSLASTFTFQLLPGAQLQYPRGYVLVGTPIKPSSAYTKVLIYVDAQTFEIDRVMLLDGQQNRNRFDFTNVQRNAPHVSATFVIVPLPNVTFIGLGKNAIPPATCP